MAKCSSNYVVLIGLERLLFVVTYIMFVNGLILQALIFIHLFP